MTPKRLALALPSVLLAATASPDWPQFRGPRGDGVASATRLPLTWSETQNVRWKTPIPGRAWSSPVVLGDQVWLTTATPDGRELSAIAVHRDTGRVIHDRKLFTVEKPQYAHPFNSYASPTPVAEPGRVYVTFGSPGTAALDARTGQVLWQRRDLDCNHFRGAGSSPVLWGDLLLMHFDGSDRQYVVALDKRTGSTVWRRDRSIDFKDLGPDGKPEAEGDYRKAFATPHVATIGGQPLLLSIGSKALYAYDPRDGTERWRVEERTSHSASTRPLFAHGLVIYPTGWPTGQVLAVRPGGAGDVTATHVAWRLTRGVPKKPSLLLDGDLVYMLGDSGVVSAVEARTGEVVWTGRVEGTYSASPLLAGGRLYTFSEDGKTTVLQAGRAFQVLAENALADGFMASPAVAGEAMYLRTKTHLYRVEDAR
jgi:outer membrane protein assembly factor BamB